MSLRPSILSLIFHHTIYHLQISASRLSRLFFLACLQDLLTLPFLFSPVSCQPFKLLPANAGTQRKREKTAFSCILQAVTLQNVHWHTGVDCIVLSMQTRCEALMYGSVIFLFYFFLPQRKTYVCQKCSLLAIPRSVI